MKCILKIGYTEILLPDDKGIATVIQTLAKGIPCRTRYGSNVITLEREELEVSFKVVSSTAKFEASEELQEKMDEMFATKAPKPKAKAKRQLKGGASLRLLPFREEI